METLSLVTMLFIGVNLDFFLILLVLLQKYRLKDVLIGYEIGMFIILIISAFAGQIIQSFIPEWGIGLLGLIPIVVAIKGENNEGNNQSRNKNGIIAVMLMYLISCGADNIAVYVPALSTMNLGTIITTIGYFIVLTLISTMLSSWISNIHTIKKLFIKWGETISRIIYGAIGVFVLFDTGLINKVIALF